MKKAVTYFSVICFLASCLPKADSYPYKDPAAVVSEAQAWSGTLEAYIRQWAAGNASPNIPASLIPKGVSDSKNFYLKNPDLATPEETWAVRYAKPIDKKALLAGIPDPKITYLFLGTALAPLSGKLVLEGEFPHCRFFSIQISPPLNGKEYYAQRQFGTAEVSITDSDIEPLPGNVNPFRVGADRNAANRKYRMEFDLTAGNPTTLNPQAHVYPYRQASNNRKGALLVYQGPLGFKTIANTPLPAAVQGPWDLGCVWIRMYEPDNGKYPLGGVPMPKVYFQLATGEKYFIGSDFTTLKKRADTTIANRVVISQPNPNFGPATGWYKSWGIVRSIFNGVAQSAGWSRDSAAHIRALDLGWTGRDENQPAPGNIEPHATTNNYATYLGRSVTVPPGMVAVLTGKLPTFPQTRDGQAVMQPGQLRYWSVVGIDQDPFSPLPATTIHAISDDDVVIDNNRNYAICYSRPGDKPANATSANGVSWVDWGTQSDVGLLMRWVNIAPDWRFSLAPQEHNLTWKKSDWSGTEYDSTLIGVNWRNGFLQCYLPRVHYMKKSDFEALGNNFSAENVPVWVDSTYKNGDADSRLGTMTASSVLDVLPANQIKNANDGNIFTAWSGAFNQSNATITLDLGAVKKISAVKLLWDYILFAKNYTLETSTDNTTWATLATATSENGNVDLYRSLKNVSGRYVRLQMTAFNTLYYRLAEFEVYTSDCNCSVPAPPEVGPNGLENNEIPDNQVTLYPNPVRTQFSVGIKNLPVSESFRVSVFDLKGKLVLQKNTKSDVPVEIPNLKSGVYLVRIETKNGRKTLRLLKTD
jgi:hypothetical protein